MIHATDTVLVIDFGAQYAQLIARRLREAHTYSEIVAPTIRASEIAAKNPIGLIFSGGPASVYAKEATLVDADIYELGIPILGICYGAQMIAQQKGGRVERTKEGEYGKTILTLEDTRGVAGGTLLQRTSKSQQVWMSHADSITQPPHGAITTASTKAATVAAFEDRKHQLFGVQFHPEVSHTTNGQQVIENFLKYACNTSGDWTMESIISGATKEIQQQVADSSVICGLSGGVDSAVAAALTHRAIGAQLKCVFVDTGLLRLNEGAEVVEVFERNFGMHLIHIEAKAQFLAALAGVTDPEAKRKTIGELFIRVFENAKAQAGGAKYLVQGTLYPDVIESGGKHASTIKSHHNVGGLPEKLDFGLVEPLRHLFKDEVRQVGRELGLPDEIVKRQPFPGPGLAVRIIGEVTPEKITTLQQADYIVRRELRNAGLEDQIWQSFAVLPDVRTVGVMGDERTYGQLVIIRAVTSEDAMTADWAKISHDVLEIMSTQIINEVRGVNRVAYDITSKPPGTIEWE